MLGINRLRLLYAVLWIAVFRGALVAALLNDIPAKPMLDVWRPRRSRLASIDARDDLSCERPEFYYTCEEHQNMIPPEAVGTCNYRNQNFHEQVYRWVAGRGCLLYTPDFLYVGGANPINLSAGCLYGNQLAPCLEIAKEDGTCGCYPFDPAFEEVSLVVREALLPSAHGRWEKCFYAASDCCSSFMISNNDTSSEQCPTTFDGWTCWHEAQPDSKAQEVCTEFVYSGEGPSCYHYSSKQCYANSTWEIQTDYSSCSVTPRLLRRFRFYIAVLAFSVASCLPAVFIFFFYKRLRITRVALHRNLLIAIIVRNILVIISRSEIYMDELTNPGETAMSRHGAACRALAAAERVAGNAVFVCMLVEGVFLHRLIVAVFRQNVNIKWLYGIGAVIATVPVIVWAIVMGLYDDHSCWLIYTMENVQWILDAPRVAILLINTVLFGDVLRVLLTKIRNSENANQLSTAKATLFLMPIFGTQFLLTAFRPNTTDCTGEQIYYYLTYSVEGLQGFIVALLYCYINKEVHSLIKATYKKTESAVVSRVRGDSHFRASLGPNSDRRMTYSTDLPTEQNHKDDPKDQYYAAVRPKLHVAEIISIQASEKLADILEPVYETIENGCYNEGYDSLDRSDVDNYSDFTPNTNDQVDNFYGFTKASSVSFDCQDWIRCVSSPSSSISTHNNDTKDEESVENNTKDTNKENDEIRAQNKRGNEDCVNIDVLDPLPIEIDDENMLNEILQYIETKENENVSLDPEVLSPNRKEDEKIVFVDD